MKQVPWALVMAAGLALGCRAGPGTAQGTAERFLDAHYVGMNLAGAKAYCVGPARQKVEEEQRLVGDQVIDESTRRPHVTYTLKEKREEGADRTSFLFEGLIRVEGAESFTRQWLVSTRRQADGTWKVSNFQEFEQAAR